MHADTKTQASGIHWEINRSKCQKGFVWEWGSPKIPCLIIISFSDMVNFATPPFFGQIRKHKNCLYKPINHGELSNSVNSFPPKAGQDAPQRRLCRMRSASTARKGQAQKLRFLLYPQFFIICDQIWSPQSQELNSTSKRDTLVRYQTQLTLSLSQSLSLHGNVAKAENTGTE